MRPAVVIADEVSAAGFRLTGVETLTPEPGAAAHAFAEACGQAELVVLTAEIARRLPQATLEAALLADRPTVTIIADVRARTASPDIAGRMKSILGIES